MRVSDWRAMASSSLVGTTSTVTLEPGVEMTSGSSERTPSLKVDTNNNVWFDFGIGKGGDIFDLAGEFIGSDDFLLRAAFIAKSGTCPLPVLEQPQRSEKKETVFEDIWVRSLQDARLLGYLEERGINAHVAIPNCE